MGARAGDGIDAIGAFSMRYNRKFLTITRAACAFLTIGCVFASSLSFAEETEQAKARREQWKAQVKTQLSQDRALLEQWKSRLVSVNAQRAGITAGYAKFNNLAKPGQDPSNVMLHATYGVSIDDGSDIEECNQQIQYLQETIEAYEQALKDIEAAEEKAEEEKNFGGGGGGCGG